MSQEFSKAVIEKIGYYVYILKDPRDSKIFSTIELFAKGKYIWIAESDDYCEIARCANFNYTDRWVR